MNYSDFKKRLDSDKAFAKKFEACDTIESLIEAAAAEGYSFTKEDIRAATVLTLGELSMVAGGAENNDLDLPCLNPSILEELTDTGQDPDVNIFINTQTPPSPIVRK